MLIPVLRFFQQKADSTGARHGPLKNRSDGVVRRSAKAVGRFMDPRPVLKESLPSFRVGYVLYRAAAVFLLELSYRMKGYEIRRQPPKHTEKPIGDK